MQGKVPGAQITQNSGGPGGGGISVRLRGTNSFISGSDPLYIVDGVIVDNGSAQLADLGDPLESAEPSRRSQSGRHRAHRDHSRRGGGGAVRIAREQRRRADLHEARQHRAAAVHAERRASRRASCASSSRSTSIRSTRTGCRSPASTIRTTSSTARRRRSRTSRSKAATTRRATTSAATSRTKTASCGRRRRSAPGARVNLQQQLASQLIGNVTANYITTNNQLQAFGEQNDYGIMGSLFFAPTNVDFRPVNGVYPLPPSLGTNPLLAIDRIRNPQTIERFIGSTKLTWTPITNLLLDYTIGIDNVGFEQRQFVPRNAVLGTAPLATGRSQSVFQSTRVINQDGVGELHLEADGPVRAAHDRRLQLHVAARAHDAARSANGLAPVGELVSAGSVFAAGADATSSCARSASTASRRSAGTTGCSSPARCATTRRRRSRRRSAGRRSRSSRRRTSSLDNQPGMLNSLRAAQRARLGGQPAGHRQRVLAVHQLHAAAVRRPPGLRQRRHVRQPGPAQRARARVGGRHRARTARAGASALEATYYDRLVSDLLFFRPLADEHRLLAPVLPDRLDVEQGDRAAAAHDERRHARTFSWSSTVTYTQQQEPRREPRHPGLPVGGRISEPHSRRLAGRRVLRLVRGAQLRHRRAAARLARPLSPQQPDGRHGRDARAAPGDQRRHLQRLAERDHRRPEPEVDGIAAQRVHDRARSCACARCSTACSATTS